LGIGKLACGIRVAPIGLRPRRPQRAFCTGASSCQLSLRDNLGFNLPSSSHPLLPAPTHLVLRQKVDDLSKLPLDRYTSPTMLSSASRCAATYRNHTARNMRRRRFEGKRVAADHRAAGYPGPYCVSRIDTQNGVYPLRAWLCRGGVALHCSRWISSVRTALLQLGSLGPDGQCRDRGIAVAAPRTASGDLCPSADLRHHGYDPVPCRVHRR